MFAFGHAGFGLGHIERRKHAHLDAALVFCQQLFRLIEIFDFGLVILDGKDQFVIRGADRGDFCHYELDKILDGNCLGFAGNADGGRINPEPKIFQQRLGHAHSGLAGIEKIKIGDDIAGGARVVGRQVVGGARRQLAG